jgi:hypothetical protein
MVWSSKSAHIMAQFPPESVQNAQKMLKRCTFLPLEQRKMGARESSTSPGHLTIQPLQFTNMRWGGPEAGVWASKANVRQASRPF